MIASVLTSLIIVMNQLTFRSSVQDSHFQGVDHQTFCGLTMHSPSYNSSRKKVHDNCQMHPSGACPERRYISSPYSVGLGNIKLPVQQVVSCISRLKNSFPTHSTMRFSNNTIHSHQSRHSLSSQMQPFGFQHFANSWRSINFSALGIYALNLAQQCCIFAATPALASHLPCVVTRSANFQNGAHRSYSEFPFVFPDESVSFEASLAK